MIRQPASRKAARGQRSSVPDTLPAPVGGWNARDPLQAMSPLDAVLIENWFPQASEVVVRKGATDWLTDLTDGGKSLLEWVGPASQELFVANLNGIFDATPGGAAGAAVTACTNGDFVSANFATLAAHYLIAVNGVDKLKRYDGTTWEDVDGVSAVPITGVATEDLTYVAVAHSRLWFAAKDSASAYYLGTAAVGGALTEFPLGQVFTKGGYLVAIGTWTIDGGDGSEDYTVFVSSEGQLAVYSGSDPASSATFRKVGVYYIGAPLGRRPLAKYGGDLLFLCRTGLYPLSRALQSTTVNRASSLTKKIDTAFNAATNAFNSNPGWGLVVFPAGGFLMVNIPVAGGVIHQYVMNTVTGAWCKFRFWEATDWIVFDSKLYFSHADGVAEAWTGTSDFLQPIPANVQQAYHGFKFPSRNKHCKLLRPVLTITDTVNLGTALAVDYNPMTFTSLTNTVDAGQAQWGVAIWGVDVWAGAFETQREWLTVFAKEFYVAAFCLQVSSSTASISWAATDFVFQVGEIL